MVNRYAYAANDPVNMLDPTGMCSESSSSSEKFCYLEDTIKSFLEPIVETAMNFAGVDVTPEFYPLGDRVGGWVLPVWAVDATAISTEAQAVMAVAGAGMRHRPPGIGSRWPNEAARCCGR